MLSLPEFELPTIWIIFIRFILLLLLMLMITILSYVIYIFVNIRIIMLPTVLMHILFLNRCMIMEFS